MYWHGPTCEVLVDEAMNVHLVHRCPSRTIAWLLVTGPVRRVTARVVAAVWHCKANTTLTSLEIGWNNMGDAGAVALADSVKVRVLSCEDCVFRACACCYRKCRFTKSSQEFASSSCCAVCVPVFVILLVASRKSFTQVCGVGGVRGLFFT